MAQENKKPLRGKVILIGSLKCDTGLHIGASKTNLDIGGLDGAVLRDPLTRAPYIPGSSLKGKLRSLFERREGKTYDRPGGEGVYRHECVDPTCRVCRLFGASGKDKKDRNLPARLIIRDSPLTPDSKSKLESIDTGLQFTEWKFENALDRITAAANPRPLERVPAGAEFDFEVIYNVEVSQLTEITEDLANLLGTMRLLEDDYLGGHGSRGYGKVQFHLSQLWSKKMDFYGATDAKKHEEASVSIQVKTVSDCKNELARALRLFS